MDVLQHSSNQNHVPNLGDTVAADVISSHQKIDDQEFFYRCTKIWKVRANQHNVGAGAYEQMAADYNDPEPESEDEIDNDDCGLLFTKSNELTVSFDSEQKDKKVIKLSVLNKSDRTRRISSATLRNQIIASQIDCTALFRPHDIKAGGQFVYHIELIGIISGVHKVKIDFKVDTKHLVRRCITMDVKNVDEIEGARITHSKAYTKKVYSEKREVVKGYAPVSTPHFIDNR